MPQDDAECCGRCQYWIPKDPTNTPNFAIMKKAPGWCHCDSPKDYWEGVSNFPRIDATGWCGKWEPRLRQVIADVDPS